MSPNHTPERLWMLSLEDLKALLLTDGIETEVKERALELVIHREVEAGYPERGRGAATLCYVCGKPTSSLHGNPSLWPRHFPHLDGPGKPRCYHVGCLYPILRGETTLRVKVDAVFPLWAKWEAEARLAARHERAMGSDDDPIARRYDCVANTYSTCEHNLREALKSQCAALLPPAGTTPEDTAAHFAKRFKETS